MLKRFPLDDVWGIGRRSFARLSGMGLRTAWDFTQLSQWQVGKMFGVAGLRTWKELRGVPCIEFEDAVFSS